VNKIKIYFGIFLLASFCLHIYGQTQADEKLLQEAKILIFDEKWEMAKEKLEELIEKYPSSPWFSQALFYKAKCLSEQKGKERDALNAYKGYIQLEEKNKSLAEESEISIIDLAYKLYSVGEKSYLREIDERLSSSNKVIKYYAAFKLSYVKEKDVALKGVPVLKEIVEEEKDAELRDRAKIALLRVSPDALRDLEEVKYKIKAQVLKIRVYEKGRREAKVSINIPWALADLALGAIPEKDKAMMREKGYDIDRIIRDLTGPKKGIIEIEGENTIIKIWID